MLRTSEAYRCAGELTCVVQKVVWVDLDGEDGREPEEEREDHGGPRERVEGKHGNVTSVVSRYDADDAGDEQLESAKCP